jgi:hypothetical protein
VGTLIETQFPPFLGNILKNTQKSELVYKNFWSLLVDHPTQLICISDIYMSTDKYRTSQGNLLGLCLNLTKKWNFRLHIIKKNTPEN